MDFEHCFNLQAFRNSWTAKRIREMSGGGGYKVKLKWFVDSREINVKAWQHQNNDKLKSV